MCMTRDDSLMREASIHAKRAGERGISARSVGRVTEVGFCCCCWYGGEDADGLIGVFEEV